MQYRNLFSPIVLRGKQVKNRIVMAPIGTNLQAIDGSVTDRLLNFLESRARGGVGMIISQFAMVSEDQRPGSLGVHSDLMLPGLRRLAETIKAYNCVSLLQIAHHGGKANKAITGKTPVAPSNIESPLYQYKPRSLTQQEIKNIIEDFVKGAERAKKAGFDGVEVHGAHTYLIGQCMSPHTNRRGDFYGGNFEGRMRFPSQIIAGIRKRCDEDFIVGFKLSAHEHLENGIDLKLAVKISQYLEEIGIDYLHISSTSSTMAKHSDYCNFPSVPSIYHKANTLVELAEEVKNQVDLPIIAAGGITKPSDAEEIIEKGQADMIALGRALIADPEWPAKTKHKGNIRWCIKDNECHIRDVLEGTELRCAVNPRVGKEQRYSFKKNKDSKDVVIIGGGPAGMEAALVAEKRGHRVTLYEKEVELGGMMRLGSIPSFKWEVQKLLEYYQKAIDTSDVRVERGVLVTEDFLRELQSDVIIVAIGALPCIPRIPGIERENVLPVTEALSPQIKLGEKLVILGAGLVGCELGWHLQKQGKRITLIDILSKDELLADEHPTNRAALLYNLSNSGVNILDKQRVLEVKESEVLIESCENGTRQRLNMDQLIVSTGFEPRKDFARNLPNVKSHSQDIYVVGDCRKVGKLYQAIHDGYHVGSLL